ncbi:MAG: hypothetical protein QW112_01450 [Candidatus Micrarchaeia archaeon]
MHVEKREESTYSRRCRIGFVLEKVKRRAGIFYSMVLPDRLKNKISDVAVSAITSTFKGERGGGFDLSAIKKRVEENRARTEAAYASIREENNEVRMPSLVYRDLRAIVRYSVGIAAIAVATATIATIRACHFENRHIEATRLIHLIRMQESTIAGKDAQIKDLESQLEQVKKESEKMLQQAQIILHNAQVERKIAEDNERYKKMMKKERSIWTKIKRFFGGK